MASINTKVLVEILFKRLTCKSDGQSPGSSIGPHWAPLSASAQGYSRPPDAPQAIASHLTPETSPQVRGLLCSFEQGEIPWHWQLAWDGARWTEDRLQNGMEFWWNGMRSVLDGSKKTSASAGQSRGRSCCTESKVAARALARALSWALAGCSEFEARYDWDGGLGPCLEPTRSLAPVLFRPFSVMIFAVTCWWASFIPGPITCLVQDWAASNK
ncbi:hypothetical protein F52700_13150 [Fusarium sp. NRRL 52700]|nr:hypothetical protein F52700_13150 [Fusarium sp. NRRL 52700]